MPKKTSGTGNKGRPKTTTEPRVKRNFNFKKSVNDLLAGEVTRTKKSANIIVEEALLASIQSAPIMDGNAQGASYTAPVVGVELAREIQRGVEDAVERVLGSRLDTIFREHILVGPEPVEGFLADLPHKQRLALSELATQFGFSNTGDLLRSLVLGVLKYPDNARQLVFTPLQEQRNTRTQKQLEEEDEGIGTGLKAA